MSKDPALMLYTSDFLVGVSTMNWEDRGKYITILCTMHQKGRLDEETIRFLVGSISDSVKDKFSIDESGAWYNERLEEEISKRRNFVQSRRDNGSKGGRPRKESAQPDKKKPTPKANKNLMVNHKDSLPENESENAIGDKKDNKEEVMAANYLAQLGSFGPDFCLSWMQWIRYKKEEHNFVYKSELTMEKAIRDLFRLSNSKEEVAIRIVDRSIGNHWKGFYRLDDGPATLKEKVESSGPSGVRDKVNQIIDQ